jgi:glycosyltransferase involved in cell wall biosynthesis
MKIALIADPELPIPPLLYGGIERIIAMLIEGYINLGHEVSLFAHRDSVTSAKLFPYLGEKSTKRRDVVMNGILINSELFKNRYDVIHSFGRLIYLFPQLPFNIPKIMSYQRQPTISQVQKAVSIARKNSLVFTGCSNYISNQISPYAPSYCIFNGINLKIYNFEETISFDAPLVFLGRVEPIKGAHVAILVAKATGKKLIIAGNIPSEYQSYFENEIRPHLNDQITYIGPVNDIKKNKLLGQALAFLMPIEWDEPFGIVMAEAAACGTPIIGFNRGSVPEVIRNGINGFICNNVQEMIECVYKINEVNRHDVRKDAESRFSSEVIVQQYLNLYISLINSSCEL